MVVQPGLCRFVLDLNNHLKCIVFNVARWCRRFIRVSTPRGTRFESQQGTFFKAGEGVDIIYVFIFYFETWIVGSFAYFFVFFFIHYSTKFMYANRRRKEPALFGWAILTGIDKHYALVICNHGTTPRGGDG